MTTAEDIERALDEAFRVVIGRWERDLLEPDRLQEAIENTRPGTQIMWILTRFQKGYSIKEVAEDLGITVTHVRSVMNIKNLKVGDLPCTAQSQK